ncbi:hypothetical protein NEFER03_1018 [Nematocida sp. LUAm3]|nr:hypothetical protein NEFER03_1018 [Nematocida sp. LUAm3]KAI5175378.1 hypothetical protein NEFER02_1307 [Nematocida sp. LUAm2]KAI5177665.1 hypothetical protein NEFER01_0889 [Nematocida sp. LUAm1]
MQERDTPNAPKKPENVYLNAFSSISLTPSSLKGCKALDTLSEDHLPQKETPSSKPRESISTYLYLVLWNLLLWFILSVDFFLLVIGNSTKNQTVYEFTSKASMYQLIARSISLIAFFPCCFFMHFHVARILNRNILTYMLKIVLFLLTWAFLFIMQYILGFCALAGTLWTLSIASSIFSFMLIISVFLSIIILYMYYITLSKLIKPWDSKTPDIKTNIEKSTNVMMKTVGKYIALHTMFILLFLAINHKQSKGILTLSNLMDTNTNILINVFNIIFDAFDYCITSDYN